MDFKQLKYFLAIAEQRQITSAAKKLNIAQPPLSYQLSRLERELGVTLVKRGSRSVQLTEAGKLLQGRAQQILDQLDSAEREVKAYGLDGAEVLTIGTISSSGCLIPNASVQQFSQQYPRARFELYEGSTSAILDLLEKGVVDLGIVRTPFQHKLLEYRYAPHEPMVAVMTKPHLCGQTPARIALEELKDKPLIIHRRFESLIEEVFAEVGVQPAIFCKNDDVRTTLSWVKAGFGIGIVPRLAVVGDAAHNLICKEIESQKLHTQIAVVWPKGRPLAPLAQQFIDVFEVHPALATEKR